MKKYFITVRNRLTCDLQSSVDESNVIITCC